MSECESIWIFVSMYIHEKKYGNLHIWENIRVTILEYQVNVLCIHLYVRICERMHRS